MFASCSDGRSHRSTFADVGPTTLPPVAVRESGPADDAVLSGKFAEARPSHAAARQRLESS